MAELQPHLDEVLAAVDREGRSVEELFHELRKRMV
jgi:hypothetical protein